MAGLSQAAGFRLDPRFSPLPAAFASAHAASRPSTSLRGWMPADPGPGDGGMGSTPGDAGGGVPGEGSDRIPPNLNTQESCIAAAKNTWEIMRDEFCPMVRDQAVCLRQNWALFLDLRQECIATFPLP